MGLQSKYKFKFTARQMGQYAIEPEEKLFIESVTLCGAKNISELVIIKDVPVFRIELTTYKLHLSKNRFSEFTAGSMKQVQFFNTLN